VVQTSILSLHSASRGIEDTEVRNAVKMFVDEMEMIGVDCGPREPWKCGESWVQVDR
jgi:hypothetical protein